MHGYSNKNISDIIVENYITQYDLFEHKHLLVRLSHIFISFNFNELQIFKAMEADFFYDESSVELNLTWQDKAKCDVIKFLVNLVNEVEFWSLGKLLSPEIISSLFKANDKSLKALIYNSKFIVDISVNLSILEQQLNNVEKIRQQRLLLLEIAEKGVITEFLRRSINLSKNNVLLLKEFARHSGKNIGGQAKISLKTKGEVIREWEKSSEPNKLQRFLDVIDITKVDSITASRIISHLL